MIENIGVLGAMPKEVELLAERLEWVEQRRIAGVEFVSGEM